MWRGIVSGRLQITLPKCPDLFSRSRAEFQQVPKSIKKCKDPFLCELHREIQRHPCLYGKPDPIRRLLNTFRKANDAATLFVDAEIEEDQLFENLCDGVGVDVIPYGENALRALRADNTGIAKVYKTGDQYKAVIDGILSSPTLLENIEVIAIGYLKQLIEVRWPPQFPAEHQKT